MSDEQADLNKPSGGNRLADMVTIAAIAALLVLVAVIGTVVAVGDRPAPELTRVVNITKEVNINDNRGIADEVERVRDSVVHIYKVNECQGSGCLIAEDGIIFTAKHVTDGRYGDYEIRMDDGRIFPVKHAIEDKENDIAFMQLDLEHARRPGPQWAPADGLDTRNYVEYMQEPNLPYAELAELDELRMGDRVFIMGSPHGIYNFNSVSLGIVSGIDRDLYNRGGGWQRYRNYNWHVMMQSTSPAFPGNSGGPIFDLDCRVVGVLVAGEAASLNFGVPVRRFRGTVKTVRNLLDTCRFSVIEEDDKVEEDVLYSQYRRGLLDESD